MARQKKKSFIKKLLTLSAHPVIYALISGVAALVPITIYFKTILGWLVTDLSIRVYELVLIAICPLILLCCGIWLLYSRYRSLKKQMIKELEIIMVKLSEENLLIFKGDRCYPTTAWDCFSEFNEIVERLNEKYDDEFETIPYLSENYDWPKDEPVPEINFQALKVEVRALIYRLRI